MKRIKPRLTKYYIVRPIPKIGYIRDSVEAAYARNVNRSYLIRHTLTVHY